MWSWITQVALALAMMWMGWDMAHAEPAPATPPALFSQHCASCHGASRLGGMGPALMPESLERLKPKDAIQVITHGRPATQMPAFGDKLSTGDIEAIAQWIYTPEEPRPEWTVQDIQASHTLTPGWDHWGPKPEWKADPLNLFVVVEGGDHHVSLVDGDTFTVIHRFPTHYALHGGPKFSPDGRYVFFGSRDGWITKYDLYHLKVVAEVRAGINMRNVAVSENGEYVMAANYLPHTVVLFDSNLKLIRLYPAQSLDGKQSSRVSAVYDAAPRKSFIVALKDIPELWEISYDPKAAPIYNGYVHDYRMGEGLAEPGTFGIRRTPLSAPLDDFFFDQDYRYAIGAARPKPGEAQGDSQVISLDARRAVAHIDLPGMPHLGSGITWPWKAPDGHETTVLASPNLKDGIISVIDMQTWKTITHIPTLGPGFFMRSHEHTPYAWVDAMMSPSNKNKLMLIDKATLKPAHIIEGEPGKTLAHIEFTRDGRYALASLWEMNGALIVYDARTFKEVKRLPMCKPVGKYNVFNKITKSEGTSH